MNSTIKQAFRAVVAACALSVVATAVISIAPATAQAQASTGTARETVEASPKGTIGLGLIGAEVGMVLPAAFGLNDLWAQITFPLLGAGAGAAAGYFLIDDGGEDSGKLGVAMMTAGMTLLIPAMVLAASLGRYDPESDEASHSTRMLARMTPAQRARAQAGPGLVRVAEGDVLLAAPAIELGALQRDGQSDRRVKVAMLSGSF